MEFELDTKSWHFKLANFGTRRVREWRDDNDLCSYIRAVFWGTFWFTLTAAAIMIAIGLTGNMFYEIYMYVMHDIAVSVFAEVAYILYTVTIALFTLLVLMWFIAEKLIPAVRAAYIKACYGSYEKRNGPPSFLTLTYRKFKEKTCFKIKFKYEE
jgi:signal transduction histidine kinase